MGSGTFGYWVGSFVLTLALPWIFLRVASRKQGTAKRLLVTIGWILGLFITLAGTNGGESLNLGNLLALVVVTWLTWRTFRQRTTNSGGLRECGLNGWQRLFVLLVAVTAIPALTIWLFSRPSLEDSWFAAGCEQSLYTSAEALSAVNSQSYRQATYSDSHCGVSLSAIAQGIPYRQSMTAWIEDLKVGLLSLSVFLAAIYALGYGIGWVWRGFRPQKPTSTT